MNRIDPDGMCDDPNCPHKSGLPDNGMFLIENIFWDMRDRATSGIVTLATYAINKIVSPAVPVLEVNYTYGSQGRVGKAVPVTGNKEVAALASVGDVATIIPGGGPTAGLLTKTVGVKAAVVDGVKSISKGEKAGEYTISEVKEALTQVHKEVGSLPKGAPGKFGSPQRGNAVKGYRLDPGHAREVGNPESVPHINWWDGTNGMKRGKGLIIGVTPIKKEF